MFKFLYILLVPASFASGFVIQDTSSFNRDEAKDTDTFYYFGYGSNLLTSRIHIQNPTAIRIGMGILQNYRLDFDYYSSRWNGAVATIVPTPNATVYGALWEINYSNLADIDNQEGVHENIYRAVSVSVILPNEQVVKARVYLLVKQPEKDINSYALHEVPFERQPSKTYLQCLVKGAIETGIPSWYVHWMTSLKHNGNVAKELETFLQLQDIEL